MTELITTLSDAELDTVGAGGYYNGGTIAYVKQTNVAVGVQKNYAGAAVLQKNEQSATQSNLVLIDNSFNAS